MIKQLSFATALMFSLLVLAPQPQDAKSACQELAVGKCQANSACTWVKGYTTKKGTKVNAHCRAKGQKQVKGEKGEKRKTDAKKKPTNVKGKKQDKDKTDKAA